MNQLQEGINQEDSLLMSKVEDVNLVKVME